MLIAGKIFFRLSIHKIRRRKTPPCDNNWLSSYAAEASQVSAAYAVIVDALNEQAKKFSLHSERWTLLEINE